MEDFIGQCLSGIELKEILRERSLQLTKFFNMEELHNGYQYTKGLNKDPNPFHPLGECEKGGFYFFVGKVDIDLVEGYVNFDISHKRKVSIPDDAQVYVERNKCKSDKLVIRDRLELSNEEFVEYFRSIDNRQKTQELCEMVVERKPWYFQDVPTQFKTREMCKKVVDSSLDLPFFEYRPDYEYDDHYGGCRGWN